MIIFTEIICLFVDPCIVSSLMSSYGKYMEFLQYKYYHYKVRFHYKTIAFLEIFWFYISIVKSYIDFNPPSLQCHKQYCSVFHRVMTRPVCTIICVEEKPGEVSWQMFWFIPYFFNTIWPRWLPCFTSLLHYTMGQWKDICHETRIMDKHAWYQYQIQVHS